jgi:beta-1,4-mannooligosaccharide/beta-1,4-mannosyl-N-acetylglucosamine phosphorylase
MINNNYIIGENLPNIPWQDRTEGNSDVLWRYTQNPVIKRDLIPSSNSIFNSAVVPFEDGFAGVFRCDNKQRLMQIHCGTSKDGINWEINNDPIVFVQDDDRLQEIDEPFECAYDPRVCKIEDKYYVTWCNGYHGYTIGTAWTKDFKTFHQTENAFLPYNRNGVMFPRKIDGKFAMLSRPSDTGHTAFGSIFYSESPDMTYWGRHRWVLDPIDGWQGTKVGPGPIPIETKDGWLMIYHGVLNSCNGFVYSFGAALLDIDQPWKVLSRTKPYLLSPQTQYECVGDVPNVAFPCAALTDAATNKIAIYYGAADTVTALAFGYVDEIVQFTKENSY